MIYADDVILLGENSKHHEKEQNLC